jgi:SAM-dependent methyltransferase
MPTPHSLRLFVVKMWRNLFVLPPEGLIPTLRANFAILRDKLSPGERPKPAKIAPQAHPIDREYGIDTSGYMGLQELDSGKSSDIYNASYCGSQPSIVRKALQALPDHRSFTFLDLGCGKGRALAVASEFPFRRIVGVELAPSVASIARANAEIIRSRFPGRTPIEIVEGDAMTAAIPDGPVVIFFYHPFYRKIMKAVLRNIEKWLLRSQSRAFVVYYNPFYFYLYDKSRMFRRFYVATMGYEPHEKGTAFDDADEAVAIWQSVGESMLEAHPQAMAKFQSEPLRNRVRLSSGQVHPN